MAEGIPLQVQYCRWEPKYEEEEYYYPPKDECRGLQLLAEGYPLFHPSLCQSYGTVEPPLQECQCHRGRHVNFGDQHPPRSCRQPPARGHPPPDQCRCRQVPVGHPPPDQCRYRQVTVGHPPPDQCLGGRQIPVGDGHPPLDQCHGGRQLPPRDGHRPPQDQCLCQQPPAGDGKSKQGQCRSQQPPGPVIPSPDNQSPCQKKSDNGEKQRGRDPNNDGKPTIVVHTPEVTHPNPEEEKFNSTDGKNGKKGDYNDVEPGPPSRLARSLCTCISIFLLLAGAIILVLWLIYRPHKPRFKVVGAAIYDLNTTFPPFMSTTMQFTIIIKNPNKRVSIYYDKLSAFVSYKDQPITPEAMMPPLHMNKHSTVEVAPVIGGTPVQVSMEVANGLAIDEIYGVMGLNLVLQGRLRWKIIGAVKTKHYGIYVNCELMLDLKKGCVGPVPLLGSPVCNVDI